MQKIQKISNTFATKLQEHSHSLDQKAAQEEKRRNMVPFPSPAPNAFSGHCCV
jgi:hypothetical protein